MMTRKRREVVKVNEPTVTSVLEHGQRTADRHAELRAEPVTIATETPTPQGETASGQVTGRG